MSQPNYSQLGLLDLADFERIRLLLNGDSVVDWSRLHCHSLEDVDKLLLRLGLDFWDADDRARIEGIHAQALSYLETHEYGVMHERIRRPDDVRSLFVHASKDDELQRDACALLKVMHIIHHAAGRELVHRLEVPTAELFFRIEKAIYASIDEMKRRGLLIVEWASSRKTEHSIITKLLCRRDSQAAQLHDRLRFRIVTETVDDVLGVLGYLCRETIPFSYVVPGESRNDLIDFESTMLDDYHLRKLWLQLQPLAVPSEDAVRDNQFTDSQYRDVNFVVDMAIRVDDLVEGLPEFDVDRFGKVVFLLAEFQIVDREQHELNQTGASAHAAYKARQVQRAIRRLRCEPEG